MTCQEFWLTVLANAIPEVIIAILFGVLIYQYNSRKEKKC